MTFDDNSDRIKIVTQALESRGINNFTNFAILKGDASTRSYYRIQNPNYSYIIMDYNHPLDDHSKDFLSIQNCLENYDIPVPHIYWFDESCGLIMLEDLGDETLQKITMQKRKNNLEHLYDGVFQILLNMQQIPRMNNRGEKTLQRSFSLKKFYDELVFFETHFMHKLCRMDLSSKYADDLHEIFYCICQEITDMQFVFTHRDFHSRNIMVKNNAYFLIDFQDARWGPVLYDLSSYLRDAYVRLPEDLIRMTRNRFYKFVSHHFSGSNHFREKFAYTCIQRNLKALGTFGFQAVERKNLHYLKYIDNLFEHLKTEISFINETTISSFLKTLIANLEEHQSSKCNVKH